MSQEMVVFNEKENITISIDPSKLIVREINIVPLASATLPAGTTLAESTITIGSSTIVIHRAAENGETRSGILLTDIAAKSDVATPPVQADLQGGIMGVFGVFKTSNIIDETVKGVLQSETLENKNLFFK